jgi:hypothetical protein
MAVVVADVLDLRDDLVVGLPGAAEDLMLPTSTVQRRASRARPSALSRSSVRGISSSGAASVTA